MSLHIFHNIELLNLETITNVNTDFFLFYSCTEDFVKYACVSLSSIIVDLPKNTKVNFVIFHNSISEINMKKVSDFYHRISNNINFIFIFINDKFDIYCNENTSAARETFYRFYCFHEKFKNIRKSIYIDTDTVITNSNLFFDEIDVYCKKLFESKNLLGVVADIGVVQSVSNFVSRFNIAADKEKCDVSRNKILLEDWWEIELNLEISKIFNAGVLLINNREINAGECDYFTIVMDMGRSRKYLFFDQDILNKVFKNKVMFLPMQFNFTPTYDWDSFLDGKNDKFTKDNYYYTAEEVRSALNNPVIIHFFLAEKPWDRAWKNSNIATQLYLANTKKNPFSKQLKKIHFMNCFVNFCYSKMILFYRKIKL